MRACLCGRVLKSLGISDIFSISEETIDLSIGLSSSKKSIWFDNSHGFYLKSNNVIILLTIFTEILLFTYITTKFLFIGTLTRKVKIVLRALRYLTGKLLEAKSIKFQNLINLGKNLSEVVTVTPDPMLNKF